MPTECLENQSKYKILISYHYTCGSTRNTKIIIDMIKLRAHNHRKKLKKEATLEPNRPIVFYCNTNCIMHSNPPSIFLMIEFHIVNEDLIFRNLLRKAPFAMATLSLNVSMVFI